MLVMDTSAVLFWTVRQERLSMDAWNAIAEAEQLIISSISIWEIGLKVKRQRLELPLPLRDYVASLIQIKQIQILPVDEQIWLKNIELEWDHKDPADRTIVATASLHGAPIVTSDRMIRSFYTECIW